MIQHAADPRPPKRGRFTMEPMIAHRAVGFRATKRPIDKAIIAIQVAGTGDTQVPTVLATIAFPCTLTGLRWGMTFTQDAGTATAFFYWAIVINRDGVTISQIATSNGSTFYKPESNCLVWGNGTIENNISTDDYIGSTKTMRKLMVGDTLQLIVKGSATNTTRCDGIIQFFCKT